MKNNEYSFAFIISGVFGVRGISMVLSVRGLRGLVSVFFEPFIELIYDTLISVMTKVDPRNLMVAIIFFKTI